MSQMDFEELVTQLIEERDPFVLEEVVRLYANDKDFEALEKLKEGEEKLHAELMLMKSKCCEAHPWFDIASAIELCTRQRRLIEAALTEIRRAKDDRSTIDDD